MPHGDGKNHAPERRGDAGFGRLSGRSERAGPLRRAARAARDLLVPAQCLGCGASVDTDDVLCPRCWPTLRMIGKPYCAICGTPFAFGQASAICAECARKPPPFARARSAVVYDAASRGLVLAFKHADRMEAAGLFARWLMAAGGDLIADADLIVPVPLHPRRLFKRRFNQAALLAQAIAKRVGAPADLDLLERVKPSPPPGKLSRAERRRAVAGAFRVAPDRKPLVAGRRVLVVDDVMTTGATAWAAARRINEAGAAAVDVLTVARAIRE